MKRRVIIVGSFFLLALFFIMFRLADIQLIHTESFTEKGVNLVQESVNQRTQEVVIDDGRGRFEDRNGHSLRNHAEPTLVLFPFLKEITWPVEDLSEIVDVSSEKLKRLIENTKEPLVLSSEDGVKLSSSDLEKINHLSIPGVFGIYRQSPIEQSIGEHLIGITGENAEVLREKYPDRQDLSYKTQIGITGLEETFDEFLLPDAETKLLYHVDGDGNPLFGVNVKYIADSNPFYPITIKTTIDKDIQEMAEDVLSDQKVDNGGLVLLDIETNEVLAMVSKPDLDRSNNKTLTNYMVQPLFPGSVFKTVISAAAIEYGLDDATREFNCNLNLYGENDGGQDDGMLTLARSFAKSCNYTFTTLAEELMEKDPNVIEDTAEKLGLLGPVAWSGKIFHYQNFKQLPEEKIGSIWGDEKDKNVLRAIDQTAIGQKDVKVTPLGVANMMATIARGGHKQQVKIVENILYKNGTNMFSFTSKSLEGEKISSYTAAKLQKLHRLVVTDPEGTGRRFQNSPLEVSGKSGTAQTGKKNDKGQMLYNKWFAGYFPSKNPKYALVVVEMDTTSAEAGTNAVFYDIVDKLAEMKGK
ncbi:peptidoglycan D,D-transpeptidase FtsI family protein [Metabacillus sediminilitoris]|uniref:Penicillin-binding protein 2 n=1 Tax=Metabacillus sediminilitoris TaxID=2567941 RepID=A0A4V3WFW1_9BACI|nr:penicillin-binding protein 2 [Metabacillus sediminilitoris]QGQ47355.1 penicillin-binding protein 2 [Metabacillus sediminilitoris]THF81790.1 penicillin-binding protein 2 [Metabacillus sediminilitoris]